MVVLLGSDPVAFDHGDAEWDYYLILQDGRRVGYSGPRPPLPFGITIGVNAYRKP